MAGTLCYRGSSNGLGTPLVCQRILFYCDNLAVVDIWRKHSSKIPSIMYLNRNLYFIAASNHFNVCVSHIQGINNTIADALSRTNSPPSGPWSEMQKKP